MSLLCTSPLIKRATKIMQRCLYFLSFNKLCQRNSLLFSSEGELFFCLFLYLKNKGGGAERNYIENFESLALP